MSAKPPAKAPPKRRPSRTIPAEHQAAALAKLRETDPATGKPYTTRGVAAWLLKVHAVKCSHMAIVRLHAAHDARSEALIVAALRETLRDLVAPTAAKLRRSLARLDQLVRGSRSVKDVAAATNAEARALREVARLGGVAAATQIDVTTNGQPLADARSVLAASIARLAQECDAAGGGRAVSDDAARDG